MNGADRDTDIREERHEEILVMIFPERMEYLTAVILKRDKEKISEALLREGVLEFTALREEDIPEEVRKRIQKSEDSLKGENRQGGNRFSGLLRKAESLLIRAGMTGAGEEREFPESSGGGQALEASNDRSGFEGEDDPEAFLEEVFKRVESAEKKRREARQYLRRLEELRIQAAEWPEGETIPHLNAGSGETVQPTEILEAADTLEKRRPTENAKDAENRGEALKAPAGGPGESSLELRQGACPEQLCAEFREELSRFSCFLRELSPASSGNFFHRSGAPSSFPSSGDSFSSGAKTGAGSKEKHRKFLLVFLRPYRKEMETILKKYRWSDAKNDPRQLPPGQKEDVLRYLEQEGRRYREKERETAEQLSAYLREKKEALLLLQGKLRREEIRNGLNHFMGGTSRTFIFSGWVAVSLKKKIETLLRRNSEETALWIWRKPLPGEEPPVLLRTPAFFKPFQWLVKNYDTPRYNSFDPTILVALSYLIMFGLMFGDVGQGLVITLAGFFIKRKSEYLGKLIFWCGMSAVTAGVLFGSYFGFSLFPPLWFDYHAIVAGGEKPTEGLITGVNDILKMTLYFGITIISIGFVLNGINFLRERNFVRFFLDKSGLFGFIMYLTGVWGLLVYNNSGYTAWPQSPLFGIIMGTGLVYLFLLPLLHHLFPEKKPAGEKKEDRKVKEKKAVLYFSLLFEGCIEVLEIFSKLLSHTLSFLRVAGLGIAHISLMTAVFQMAEAGGSPLVKILIYVIGNGVVIVLEGFSAGVQALRLNYYEFFSKYFRGNGREYRPQSFRRGAGVFSE